ncbi:hypothetical protein DM02DRAFT_685906 [Periconia macrospinosa]|uniref:Uncharacterized protein n=1 Tax=Periconia macrospinosa TaxID=97972 RepID=A0A2V1DGP5_9PLEO|nr:hypothetical protein DM02DRAFT_685906 [Periconia macrospinosa]
MKMESTNGSSGSSGDRVEDGRERSQENTDLPTVGSASPQQPAARVDDNGAPPQPRNGRQSPGFRPHISGIDQSTSPSLSPRRTNCPSRLRFYQGRHCTSAPAMTRKLRQSSRASNTGEEIHRQETNTTFRMRIPRWLRRLDDRESRGTIRRPDAPDQAQDGSGLRDATCCLSRRLGRFIVQYSTDRRFWRRKAKPFVEQIKNVCPCCKGRFEEQHAESSEPKALNTDAEPPESKLGILDVAPEIGQSDTTWAREVEEDFQHSLSGLSAPPLPSPSIPSTLVPISSSIEADSANSGDLEEENAIVPVYVQSHQVPFFRALSRSENLLIMISPEDLRKALRERFQPDQAVQPTSLPLPQQPEAQGTRNSPPNRPRSPTPTSHSNLDVMSYLDQRVTGLGALLSNVDRRVRVLTQTLSNLGNPSQELSVGASNMSQLSGPRCNHEVSGVISPRTHEASLVPEPLRTRWSGVPALSPSHDSHGKEPVNGKFEKAKDVLSHSSSVRNQGPRTFTGGRNESKTGSSNPPVSGCKICQLGNANCGWNFYQFADSEESEEDEGRRSFIRARSKAKSVGRRNTESEIPIVSAFQNSTHREDDSQGHLHKSQSQDDANNGNAPSFSAGPPSIFESGSLNKYDDERRREMLLK